MNRSIKPIRVEGNIAYVPLTQGYEAIIDAEDVPLIDGRPWYAKVARKKNGSIARVYAVTKVQKVAVFMHREILRAPVSSLEVDHIDSDGLNNRRANLRLVTVSENQMNRKISISNSSGYKGVCWNKRDKFWRAAITKGKVKTWLGNFRTAEDAAAAYARASAEIHGEYGRLR